MSRRVIYTTNGPRTSAKLKECPTHIINHVCWYRPLSVQSNCEPGGNCPNREPEAIKCITTSVPGLFYNCTTKYVRNSKASGIECRTRALTGDTANKIRRALSPCNQGEKRLILEYHTPTEQGDGTVQYLSMQTVFSRSAIVWRRTSEQEGRSPKPRWSRPPPTVFLAQGPLRLLSSPGWLIDHLAINVLLIAILAQIKCMCPL